MSRGFLGYEYEVWDEMEVGGGANGRLAPAVVERFGVSGDNGAIVHHFGCMEIDAISRVIYGAFYDVRWEH